MIEWIDYAGKAWGRWMRKTPSAWPRNSLLWKIHRLGPGGAAIKSHEVQIPIDDMPEGVAEFHRAYEKASPKTRRVIHTFYVLTVPKAEKARILGVSRATLYRTHLHDAHCEIISLLGS